MKQEKRYELEIRNILFQAFENTTHNVFLENINVEFNQRKSQFANAEYGGWFRNHTIYVSIVFWPKLTKKQKKELIVHEFFHIVAEHKGQIFQPHKGLWAQLMKEFGYKPKATYDW